MATITLRLTKDNVETALKPGDVFTDDPDFGTVKTVRLTSGDTAAKVFTDKGHDLLGLPSTVRITR